MTTNMDMSYSWEIGFELLGVPRVGYGGFVHYLNVNEPSRVTVEREIVDED